MHAILATIGTDGDVLPYVGLGRVLRQRGHRVTLVTSERDGPMAAEHGIEFAVLVAAGGFDALLNDRRFWHPVKGPMLAARWGATWLEQQYRLLSQMAAADAVLVASPAVLAGRLLAEARAIPLATVILQPWMIQSVYLPPVMPAGPTLPRLAPWPLGHLYWRLIDGTGWMLFGRQLNALRRRLGLTPVCRVFRWWQSPQRIIGLFPDWYGPPQADWPAQLRLAGFPHFDGAGDQPLSPDLVAFCAEGDAPIAFTFGTGMMHGGELFAACAQACRLLGRRGLFVTKHEHQLPSPLPGFLRHVRSAPFRLLFPRCAAVVHHGGIGTASEALAAGTPQLVLPIAYDQFDNAVRVERLGAGEWLGRRRRSGRRIADALARILSATARERCREVAATANSDLTALARAADWIEQLHD